MNNHPAQSPKKKVFVHTLRKQPVHTSQKLPRYTQKTPISTQKASLVTLLTCAFCLFFLPYGLAGTAFSIPIPQGIQFATALDTTNPEVILEQFLRIPYRIDGALDDKGNYTLFAKPEARFSKPGLNCSGFTLAVSRFLLRKNFTIEQTKHDRLNDSYKGAPLGEDWDFGWDVIMNIASPFPHKMLLPGFKEANLKTATGLEPKGFNLALQETWDELLQRFQTKHMYLVSWSQKDTRPGYEWMHYHAGIIHKTEKGAVWLYQTTRQGGSVNRRDLASKNGLDSFLRDFISKQGATRYLTIIEVTLP